MSDGRLVGAVFARGGSKGIPRKNLRLLGGKPLLVHALEALGGVPGVWRILVSTDDAEIAGVASGWGAEIVTRPAPLAADDAPEWLAWRHLVETVGSAWGSSVDDVLLVAPTTSPLRVPGDLDRAATRLREGDVDVVISVTPAARNPYFNMVTIGADGRAAVMMKPETPIFRRQDAPAVFDVTTVAYAASPQYVLTAPRLFAGRVGAIVVPAERALDIDTPHEFEMAEILMARRQVDAAP